MRRQSSLRRCLTRWPVDRRWSGLLPLRDPASSRPGHPPKLRQSSALILCILSIRVLPSRRSIVDTLRSPGKIRAIRGSLKSSQKNKKSHDCKSRNQTHRCLIFDLCSSVSICGFPFFCFALVAASPRWVLSCPEHQAQVINDLNATENDAVNAANAIR